MVDVTLIVPLDARGDPTGERARNWSWLAARYRALFTEWYPIIATDPGEFPFSKARAVNAAAARARGEVLVIADADLLAATDSLYEAVEHARADPVGRWVVPFGDVYRLNAAATERALNADPSDPGGPHIVPHGELDRDRLPYRGRPGGGIVVLGRAAFASVGGFDERFVGWGGEDDAFGYALKTCIGKPVRMETPLWHLWHEPQPGYDAAGHLADGPRRLLRRYRHATQDAATMRALLAERSDGVP